MSISLHTCSSVSTVMGLRLVVLRAEGLLPVITGSLDNVFRGLSLTQSLWLMSHYTMLDKYGNRTPDCLGVFTLNLFKSSLYLEHFY